MYPSGFTKNINTVLYYHTRVIPFVHPTHEEPVDAATVRTVFPVRSNARLKTWIQTECVDCFVHKEQHTEPGTAGHNNERIRTILYYCIVLSSY